MLRGAAWLQSGCGSCGESRGCQGGQGVELRTCAGGCCRAGGRWPLYGRTQVRRRLFSKAWRRGAAAALWRSGAARCGSGNGCMQQQGRQRKLLRSWLRPAPSQLPASPGCTRCLAVPPGWPGAYLNRHFTAELTKRRSTCDICKRKNSHCRVQTPPYSAISRFLPQTTMASSTSRALGVALLASMWAYAAATPGRGRPCA